MEPSRYEEIYEPAYRGGYHRDGSYTHSKPLLTRVLEMYPNTKSAIDFGASNGAAIRWLQSRNVIATGIEISSTAVAIAANHRTMIANGSICEPNDFKTNVVELAYSTDVMEHLSVEDIDKCISEQVRVSNHLVAAKIATKKARVLQPFRHMGAGFNPHLTVQSIRWWWAKYMQQGLELIWTDGNDSAIFRKIDRPQPSELITNVSESLDTSLEVS